MMGKVFLTPPDMTAHQVASYRLVALSAPRSRFRNNQGPLRDFPVNQSRARLTFGWYRSRGTPRGTSCLGLSLEDLLAIRGAFFPSQAPTQPPTSARKPVGNTLFGTSWRNSMLRHTCQLYEFAPVVKLGRKSRRLAGYPPRHRCGFLTAGTKTGTRICGPQFYARDPPLPDRDWDR